MCPHVINLGSLVEEFYVDQARMIRHSAYVAQSSVGGIYDGDAFTRTDIVRYCFLHIWIYREYITAGRTSQQSLINEATNARESISWSDLWTAIGSAVRRYSRDKKWDASDKGLYWHIPTLPILTPEEILAGDRDLAGKCLEIIGSIEEGSGARGLKPHAGQPTFPDELVTALGLFILPENVSKYPRLARLQGQEHVARVEVENAS